MKRMRVFLMFFVLWCGSAALAQDKKWPSDPASPIAPWTLAEASSLAQFVGHTWSLSLEFKNLEYPVLSRDAFISGLRATASDESASEKRADRLANRRLLKANIEVVVAALQAVPEIAGDSELILLGKGDVEAVLFARRGETRCLIVPRVAVETVFNTLRTEPKERAEKIATTIAIPTLRAIASIDQLDRAGIKCIGVGVSFGAKSFAHGGAPLADMTETEFLGATGLINDIRSFAQSELAEEELLGRLDIFSQDRSMGPEIKKILLGVRK